MAKGHLSAAVTFHSAFKVLRARRRSCHLRRNPSLSEGMMLGSVRLLACTVWSSGPDTKEAEPCLSWRTDG
jgi:hypothetical protein